MQGGTAPKPRVQCCDMDRVSVKAMDEQRFLGSGRVGCLGLCGAWEAVLVGGGGISGRGNGWNKGFWLQ